MCPVCASVTRREVRIAHRKLWVCLECNYVYLNDIDHQAVNPNWHSDSGDYYLSDLYDWREAVMNWRPRVAELSTVVPRFPSVRALDYGAGAGFLVKALRDAGSEAEGVEISPKCIEFAQNKLEVPVRSLVEFQRSYEHGELTARFDLCTSYHVLEHLDAPRQLRDQMHGILRPGGIWSIEIPNILSYESVRMRDGWSGLSLGIHRGFMTAKTFEYFLREKFRIMSIAYSVADEFYDGYFPYLRQLTDDQTVIAEFARGLTGTVVVVTAQKLPA